MRDDVPVTRSSLVPVLGCLALLLFGLNFYRFLDREFLSQWDRWDLCEHGLACCDHVTASHVIWQDATDDGVHIEMHAAEENDRARALQRNLERAERELERLSHRLDDRSAVDIERLHEDIRIKSRNLERLARDLAQEQSVIVDRCEADRHERRIQIHVH